MPLISQFFGIAIYMYYEDHNPPHFHAVYGDSKALIDIKTHAFSRGIFLQNKLNKL